jgi:hypothetical protein
MVLYFTERKLGRKVVSSGTAYGNSPEEVRDRTLARKPLASGERIVVRDFTGSQVL